ncbi:MAG: hypothetical protein FWE44_03385 [Defluviitaleaceae bacterium]|nr:hypothetical protein [Defluviitaleaceae bacterium]
MIRRLNAGIAALLVALALSSATVFAQEGSSLQRNVGDWMGYVLHTDIRVFVNNVEIMGYNIDGQTFVVASDLRAFNINVFWDEDARVVKIARGASNEQPRDVGHTTQDIGSIAHNFYYTDIAVYIDDTPVESFNINGSTVVRITDVADAFGSFLWAEEHRLVLVMLTAYEGAHTPNDSETYVGYAALGVPYYYDLEIPELNFDPSIYSVAQITLLDNLLTALGDEMPNKIHRGSWFGEDGLRSTLPRNVPLQIIDLRTGITYNVASFSNGNHADVETLTAHDTALMFQTQPASWTGRPVVVVFENRAYVAAIHTMPHAGATITGNNMNGHICLHFHGSTQHVTPNAVYAAQINQAYEIAQIFNRYFSR